MMKFSLFQICISFCALLVLSGFSCAAWGEDDLVKCPQCTGTGQFPCKARCKAGKQRCPNSCLKKDDPGWIKGPDGSLIKNYPITKKGMHGNQAFTPNHIGQLIVYEDGRPIDKGACPTCMGTSFIPCKMCAGKGTTPCVLCHGSGLAPKQAAEEYEAKQKAGKISQIINLKDGRAIHGRIISQTNDVVIIKTDEGVTLTVKPEELVPAKQVEDKAPQP